MLSYPMKRHFFERGWCRFPHDSALLEWGHRALPAARRAIHDPENARHFLCGGTWFLGTNVLPNDATGSVSGGPTLTGKAIDFICDTLGLAPFAWDMGQVSVCYPGYPRSMESESEAAHRYRRNRDGAHIDGLLAEGPQKRRFLREYHAFLLGIPMVEARADASPLVVWEGSHEIIRGTFKVLFKDIAPQAWGDIDVTEAYWSARRKIFSSCDRVKIAAKPGEAYLVHRLSLHGIAPWSLGATSGPDGRMICYFRPQVRDPRDWLYAA